ncbi:hypothetical protein [Paracoccus amoyensis]|uniref:hypothetical protein n=1 Tax=Paracoccus amoyensis TaxID=2760093 RepID=UPI0016598E0E|nr:hypothetical protein [Paracoccus amoyensis]
MSVKELFDSLRHRMSWTSARKILQANGISTSYGWDATLEKISEQTREPETGRIEDGLIEHLLCGQKFTKLYPLDPGHRETLQARIAAMAPADCPATQRYPYKMDDSDLLHGNGDMLPVRTESSEDGVGLVLSSVFWIKRREEISFQEFDKPSDMKARYDEVVGIVREPVQMFHVIWIPHHRDFLEIRVDSPCGVAEADIHGLHSVLRTLVNGWGDVTLGKPVNLFPAVRPFYDDVSEGTVTQMTFQTTTGGIKDEKLPRRRRDADQRTEAYHVAGKEAVEAIAIYRITVEWGFSEDNIVYTPSISLSASGPAGNSSTGDPVITGALIENCVRAVDYEFVIDRLGRKAKLDEPDVPHS